ncbi:Fe-S type hydro-lyase tartrate/fumarate beta region [Methanothermus fervidus DSM 2088]|uniref:Fe-S type hydro-lyase tartrate/fumarate beta region n=1 Tax=Methanothermus fervidus (strain ATCC 43054 / DSM 2088 / JCM 10308 / V24 S) TaxID=523846 RepID=E3GX94_METFV|nr:fumarate hydratase C-terminal domain-containing protein [Methanothermus fervidus]ADP76926.1 Fe-S type hydro-lyase tartrate/fumarate beta region [Methanothermus fervidus DSM 2088]
MIINTPVKKKDIKKLKVGDKVSIYGYIYTGRDAALPKLVKYLKNKKELFNIEGSVIMHTAVTPAGIGPTSSNKKEIEENIPYLVKKGARIHIGKGYLKKETVDAINRYCGAFVITPPISAYLTDKIISKEVVAFPEEGMEAIFKLKVEGIPGIVAVANGKSLF